MTITDHVTEQERKSLRLRQVCEKPRVLLDELEDEAKQVGMDRKEVMRALQFLRKTGSVLNHDSIRGEKKTPDTHRGSPTLQNTSCGFIIVRASSGTSTGGIYEQGVAARFCPWIRTLCAETLTVTSADSAACEQLVKHVCQQLLAIC